MSDDVSEPGSNKVIVLPGGQTLDPDEIGASFIVSAAGQIPTGELLDPADVKQELKDRIAFVKNQPLVKAVSEGSQQAINAILVEIAEELSHIKFERRKVAANGRSTAALTVARVNGLKQLAETLLRRKETAMAEQLDLKSPRLQKIFKVWMDFFYEAMQRSGVSSEIINVVFQQMKADMIGWESKMSEADK